MKLLLCLLLLMLSASYGCESEERRRALEVTAIMNEAKRRPESLDALHRLEPYLNHDSAFVRRWACQVLGEIYEGTHNDEIASRCATIFLDKLDEHRQNNITVTKHAARSLLRIGLPPIYPDSVAIERKLRSAAKALISANAAFDCMDALAVIPHPSDHTLNTLVECLHYADESDGEFWWKCSLRHHAATAIARFGSRASFVLPDLRRILEETPSSEFAYDEIAAAIKTIEEAVAKEKAESEK